MELCCLFFKIIMPFLYLAYQFGLFTFNLSKSIFVVHCFIYTKLMMKGEMWLLLIIILLLLFITNSLNSALQYKGRRYNNNIIKLKRDRRALLLRAYSVIGRGWFNKMCSN